MSTKIDIKVDLGGILQRNRQQTIANRQATLKAKAREAAAAEGAAQREARLSEAEATRRAGQNKSQPFTKDELAANRSGSALLLGPYTGSFNYNNRVYFLVDDFAKKQRALPEAGQGPSNGLFASAQNYTNQFPNPLRSTTFFAAGMGPQGSNAICMEAFTPWGGGYSVSVTGCRVISSSPPLPENLNPGETYDSIEVVDPFLDALGYDGTYTQYGWPNCELATVNIYQSAYAADCTLEFDYFFDSYEDELRRTAVDSSRSTWEIYLKKASSCPVALSIRVGPLVLAINPDANLSTLTRRYNAANVLNPVAYPVNVSSEALADWTHVAIVTDASEGRLYIDGQLVVTVPNSTNLTLEDPRLFFEQFFYGANSPTPSLYGPNVTSALYVHGMRMTRKTRYTGNSFTPPPVIR